MGDCCATTDEGSQGNSKVASAYPLATKAWERKGNDLVAQTVSDPGFAVQILLSLVVVLANGAVVFTIVRPGNKHTLRTPIDLLILQLAIVDLLIGVVVEPMNIYNLVERIYSPGVCAVYLSLSLALDKASVVGFLMISIERFVAIRFPFQKKALFTVRNVTLTCAVAWMACFIYGLIPTLLGLRENWDAAVGCRFERIVSLSFQAWAIALTTVVEGVVVSGIYSYLFVVARRHMRSIASLHVPVTESGPWTSSGFTVADVLKTYTRQELNIAFRCLVLIFIHFLCQWPLSMVMLLSWNGIVVNSNLGYSLVWLRRLNSTLNPLCYAFAKKDLRQKLKKTLTCGTV